MLDYVIKSRENALFLLKDFHSELEKSPVVRRVRDVVHHLKRSHKTLLVLAPVLELPGDLVKDVTVVDVPLPSLAEQRDLLTRFLHKARSDRRFTVTVDEDLEECVFSARVHVEADDRRSRGDGRLGRERFRRDGLSIPRRRGRAASDTT